MPKEVGNFDILNVMSKRNMKIYLGLDVTRIRKVRAGTLFEVGIGGDFINGMAAGTLRACLLVWDTTEYEAIKTELSSEGG